MRRSDAYSFSSRWLLILLLVPIIASCAHDATPQRRSEYAVPLVTFEDEDYSEQGRQAAAIIYPMLTRHRIGGFPNTHMRHFTTVYVSQTDAERARKLVAAAIKEHHLEAKLQH